VPPAHGLRPYEPCSAAAWFGPKGFASTVFGLLILGSGVIDASHIFHLLPLSSLSQSLLIPQRT
jgi:hypothetical protein